MRFPLSCALTSFGLAAVGCGETPPIIPRAAWTVSFEDTGVDCQIASHNSKMGDVSNSAKLRLLEDGQVEGTGTAAIECTVAGGAGGPFDVSAQAIIGDRGLNIVIPSLSLDATDAAPVQGGLSYSSVNTQAAYTTSPDALCDFYFTPQQDAQPGSTWLSFKCAALTADQSVCAIAQGYAAFENCLAVAN